MKTKCQSVEEIKFLLDAKVIQYNQPGFIENDPITIPHQFSKKQDIEIAGFFAAILAWGQRVTIINSCRRLFAWMDNDPHLFILYHREKDLKPFLDFRHRTFNATDALYFIAFLQQYYSSHYSLEDAFCAEPAEPSVEKALIRFHNLFFSLPDHPLRTRKHVATPERRSTCKRLAMYLRWMVRNDNCGVDFGIWTKIKPAQLVCPLDVHVERVARKLRLIKRKQTDWHTVLELTEALKKFDPIDPVKYDFALFGIGLEEKLTRI
ncbi:MAG: TIGR02757 family protein [Cyclobacteriaceae bacterium]|nr:TIGR02757 family protein [Cyclobacteriaceae bacterium]